MSDFSRSPRLQLEKLFAAVAEAQLKVSLSVGFFPHRKVFPDWVLAQPRNALIPIGVWDDTQAGYRLMAIPSLFEGEVLKGYLDFVSGLCQILSLYQAPEGPIVSTRFHWDLYESDQNTLNHPRYVENLKDRYGAISSLNEIFQTSFNSFEATVTRQGFRVLAERRGWLAAHDYKAVRRKILATLKGTLPQFPSTAAMTAPKIERGLFLDTTLIEKTPSSCHPLSPGGHAFSASTEAFSRYENLPQRARAENVSVYENGDDFPSSLKELGVVSGKYLPRADLDRLKSFEARGGNLCFLGSVPAYDENLTSIASRARARDFSQWEFAKC